MTDEAAAPKRERITTTIDQDAGTVVLQSPDGSTSGPFQIAELPDFVRAYLALDGLRSHLRGADFPATAFDDLKNGNLPGRRPAAPQTPSHWRQAIANALVEQTRKTATPMTPDAALATAKHLDRVAVAKAKLDPVVVKHHAKLSGAAGVLSLLGADAAESAAA